jgi:hypothetical protein
MSHNKDFDRMIRQKMNEREFAFEEAHWLAAKEMIDSRRGRWRYFYLLWLLVPAVAVVLFMGQAEKSGKDLAQPNGTSLTINTGDRVSAVGVSREVEHTAAEGNEAVASASEIRSEEIITAKGGSSAEKSGTGRKLFSGDEPRQAKMKTEDAGQSATTGSKSRGVAFGDGAKSAHSTGNELNVGLDGKIDSELLHAGIPAELDKLLLLTAITELENTVMLRERKTVPSLLSSREGRISGAAFALMQARPVNVERIKWWKITAGGGVMSHDADIRNAAGQEVYQDLSGLWSPVWGIDIMRNHRHFAWGTGLHLTTYAEQGRVAADSLISVSNSSYWRLIPVDTAVWVTTDSIANGNGYTYIGYSQTQTVQVLNRVEETRYERQELRAARNIRNQVSYLEIPLLADVHFGRGRWLGGVRFGPGLGRVIIRSGALPSADNGYSDIDNHSLKLWVPTYQCRIYTEYKLGQQWAAGISAGMRGVFGNTLSNDIIVRRSQGLNAMLQLSYSFPTK